MARPSKPHRTSMGYWRCRIDGVQHHLGKNKQAAYREFHRLMAQAGHLSVDRPAVVAELVANWLDLNYTADNSLRLADFAKFGGRLGLEEVGRDTLEAYHRYLMHPRTIGTTRRKLGPKTIVDRMRIARRVIRWGVRQGWIDVEPDMPKLARPVRKARDIPPDVLAEAFAALPKRAGQILRFILSTGCRPSEAVRLKWEDVDLDRGVCIVYEHKTGAKTGLPRTLYLTPEAHAILSRLADRTGHVFTSRLHEPYTVAGLRSVLRRRGIQSVYSLRHTFAQNASEQIAESELAKLMGHRDPATTRLYYEVRDQRAKAAAQALVGPLPAHTPADVPSGATLAAHRKKTPGARKAARKVS